MKSKKKDIPQGIPVTFLGNGLVELTDSKVRTPRKEITKKAAELIAYCDECGYSAFFAATPDDCFEKLKAKQSIKNVILGMGSARHLAYVMARHLKSVEQIYGVTPQEMLKSISGLVEEGSE